MQKYTQLKRTIIDTVLVAATLTFLILAGSGPAVASGGYGAHLAYSKAADSDEGNVLVGAHLELGLARFLGLVGAVDYRSSERFGATAATSVQVKSVPITLSGRLYLPAPAFAPFVQAGAGWYRVIYDYSEALESRLGRDDQSVTTFGWHAGAGAKIQLARMLSLTGEARYVFVDPQKDLEDDVRDEIRNLDYDSAYFGAGLTLEF